MCWFHTVMPCVHVCVNNFCILMYRYKSRVWGIMKRIKGSMDTFKGWFRISTKVMMRKQKYWLNYL